VIERAPIGVDVSTANVARIYDYFLGGKDNFAVDRKAAAELTAIMPLAPAIARQNRAFALRAVRILATDYGIRQFIDVGAGLPVGPTVHTVARAIARSCRVVYVDNDPVVCSHGRAVLEGEASAMVQADLREPDEILGHPLTQSLIDFTKPFALLATAVLHFVPDEADPRAIVARFRDAMAPGSFVVISHGTLENLPGRHRAEESVEVYKRSSAELWLRSLDEVRGLFDGFELLDPGVVHIGQWRPGLRELPDLDTNTLRGGVGRLVGQQATSPV
jgi:hypothetical protein